MSEMSEQAAGFDEVNVMEAVGGCRWLTLK